MDEIREELEKLRTAKPSAANLQKMPPLIARMLDQAAIGWTGKMYNGRQFQKLAKLDSLTKTEQERIFNEVILAPLTMLMLTFEAPDLNQPDEFKDFLRSVRDEIPKVHVAYLKEIGVEKKFLKLWDKLLAMRFEEYARDKLDARQAMMDDKAKEEMLEMSGLREINLLVIPFTVAVGCHQHICRGKGMKNQELFKYLMKELSRFYLQFRLIAEGIRLTPGKKLRLKARHLARDVKKSLGIEKEK